MPRKSAWTDLNREKLRAYNRQWRKDHLEYFKDYEKRHWLKLKIQRKIWMKKNRWRLKKYWSQEQHAQYVRQWRLKKKEDRNWQLNYLQSLCIK